MVITDKKLWVKYISSFVVGDGCLALAGNRNNNARYHLSQIAIHEDYVDWQANILENICPVVKALKPAHVDNNGWKHQDVFTLTSRSLPFFTTLRNRWYLEGKKVMSPHDILLFDAESLAILYMDDGCLNKNSGRSKRNYSITLSTQSFSWADNKLLRDYIADKFDVHFNIKKVSYPSGMKYCLYCTQKQVPTFIKIVKPYILPSFLYKTELPNDQALITEGHDII